MGGHQTRFYQKLRTEHYHWIKKNVKTLNHKNVARQAAHHDQKANTSAYQCKESKLKLTDINIQCND